MLIYYQPRILIVIAIIAIIYKLNNLTANQKASLTKVKNSITNPISKFLKAHWKHIIYSICLLVFFIIMFSILGSLSTNEDNIKDTKNQVTNNITYNPKEIVNDIIWSGKNIEEMNDWVTENLEIEEKEEIHQESQDTKLYDSNWKEIFLDPIDMNDYPDFNRNMDISLYNNCQVYTWRRKSKIENERKSRWGSRWCRVAVIYSEPDDACLWLSACSSSRIQYYNMMNLKTNKYVYSCTSSNCETEFQKKLDVLWPFPAYEYIFSENLGINNNTTSNNKTTTTTTYTPTYTSSYNSNSNRTSSNNSYNWYDDPEPSEFYEYDNFDDYYSAYWDYYDDYSYDELKDMYNDEKRSNSPYQWYEDYYEDLRYDYYWWYGWYDKHIDEFEDEYWYFEE